MANEIWYFSKGEKKHGPISTAQLKTLISTNKIPPDGLVFQEGMSKWTPANQVKGLVSQASPAPAKPAVAKPQAEAEPTLEIEQESVTKKSKKRGGSVSDGSGMFLSCGRVAGTPLVFVGILLVVFSKGCDTVGQRGVARTTAIAALEENDFEYKWNQKIEDEDDRAKKNELRDKKKKAKEKLEKGAWKGIKNDAKNAAGNNAKTAYWRSMIFAAGAILLTTGLMFVGFTGEGPERWICLIMLAIITYSVFVIGTPGESFSGGFPEGLRGGIRFGR